MTWHVLVIHVLDALLPFVFSTAAYASLTLP